MSGAELREHRLSCVVQRLKELKQRGVKIRLVPKDPDPFPDFGIEEISNIEVDFQKLSNHQYLRAELQKIAEITLNSAENVALIRLLGRVRWNDSIKEWQFAPTLLGRPRRETRK